jgi:hypothetical protein
MPNLLDASHESRYSLNHVPRARANIVKHHLGSIIGDNEGQLSPLAAGWFVLLNQYALKLPEPTRPISNCVES